MGERPSIPAKVAIVGCGRSGTTLLYNMLRNTVTNFGTYESEVPLSGCQDGYISKRPLDVLQGPQDGVKYIVLVRDPRDILCSIHKAVPGDFFYSWDACYTIGGDKTAPGVLAMFKAMDLFSGYFIKYEKLVTGPDLVQNELAEQFGFEYAGKFSQAHKKGVSPALERPLNGLRAPDTNSIGKWKEHKQRIAQQFAECPALFDYLKHYGYEKDRTWTKHLHLPLPA